MMSKLCVLMLAGVLVFGQSCNVYDVMVGGTKVGAAEQLWEGVPQVEGATKVDVALPPQVRRQVEGMLIENLNYVAYSTDRTATEVESIYSKDRMANAGWRPASRCLGDVDGTGLGQGGVCIYYRTPDPDYNILAIHIAEDVNTKRNIIFYMRFQLVFDK